MGNCKRRVRSPFMSAYSSIGGAFQCPKCSFNFPATTSHEAFNFHLDLCLANHNFAGTQANSLENSVKQSKEMQIWKKNVDKWEVDKTIITPERLIFLKNATPQQINRSCAFSEKLLYFRLQMDKLRIPWTKGSDAIMIRRDSIVADSLNFINVCNMQKEIKIFFEGDKVQDAGGLLREWIYLVSKELAHKEHGILVKTATAEALYRLNENADMVIENMQKVRLLGKVVGKAVFDRIPINLSFCRPLLRILLNEKVTLDDIKYYDSQLFESWTFLQGIDLQEETLEQDFTIFDSKSNCLRELKPGGKNINVTQSNKQEYIDLSLKHVLEKAFILQQLFTDEFHKIVPLRFLQIFNVEELEALINGVSDISVDEWFENTEYKGKYNINHQVVQWFWGVMRTYNQEQLSKMLHFCTGSSRISLEGFKNLESNRGTLTKFCIESSEFTKKNPFIKAHTCFNRLEIPLYQSLEELRIYMRCIVENNFEGVFGLE